MFPRQNCNRKIHQVSLFGVVSAKILTLCDCNAFRVTLYLKRYTTDYWEADNNIGEIRATSGEKFDKKYVCIIIRLGK